MNILVTGDRNWDNYSIINRALWAIGMSMPDEFPASFICVIHGKARGADTLAGMAARAWGMSVREYPAEWDKYGKGAGIIRNQQMLDSEDIDLVLAFHDDLEHSKGTGDMVRRAKEAGLKIKHYSHQNPDGVVIQ